MYELKKMYQQEHDKTRSQTGIAVNFVERMSVVEDDRWREEWSVNREDNWTKKLIGDACTFKKYKRNIDHWTMQLLIEHEIFNAYRKTISKEVHSICWDCDTEVDDAVHALSTLP